MRTSPAADEETARLRKRTQMVVMPLWAFLMILAFVLAVSGSSYVFVPFAATFAIAVVTNIYLAVRRSRIIAEHPRPEPASRAPMVRDQRSGRWVAADDLRAPIVNRLRTGVRAMLMSTRCQADAADPFDAVQRRLYEASVTEDVTYSSRPSPNGAWIELALRAPNIRNRFFMNVKGELTPGSITTFTGSIQPDAQMRILGIAPVLLFFIAGPILVIVGVGSLFVPTVDHGGTTFMMIWGVVASIISSSFILKFASMYETQVHLLRRVFGDRLTLGGRPIADV